jgi:hypothetical protein
MLTTVANILDSINPWLLGASAIISAFALVCFYRTRDGMARKALLAIMAVTTLTFTLTTIHGFMRQAGYDLSIIYIANFVSRLATLAALLWLLRLLIRGRRA